MKLNVVLFPLSSTAAIYVGADRGCYARAGIDVELTATPDSQHLIEGLTKGRYQLAAALIDNFVAYCEGQHAIAYDADHDIRVVMGLSTASVALVARSDVFSVGALRGCKIGVDAPGTGFAFVLYRMLSHANVGREDFQLVRSGSTRARWLALARGDIDATMLTPEFTAQAITQGFHVLQSSERMFKAYMGVSVAADPAWASRNGETVAAFIRATLEARRWLARPENLPVGADILSRELGGSPQQMGKSLQTLLAKGALTADGKIDAEGLATVLDLRREYGRPARTLPSPQKYLDLNYLARAQQELATQ